MLDYYYTEFTFTLLSMSLFTHTSRKHFQLLNQTVKTFVRKESCSSKHYQILSLISKSTGLHYKPNLNLKKISFIQYCCFCLILPQEITSNLKYHIRINGRKCTPNKMPRNQQEQSYCANFQIHAYIFLCIISAILNRL